MPPINQPQYQPDALARLLADFQHRLERLESSPQLGNTQINAGSLTVTDAQGNVLITVGLLPNGSYGFEVDSAPGGPGTMFLADANGVALPFTIAPFRPVVAGTSVAGTTLASIYQTEVELLQWDSVRVRVPWATGTAAGSLQLAALNLTGVSTTVVTLPAASSGTQDFRWLHGIPLNEGPVYFSVQAATSLASAPITIWQPDGGLCAYRGGFMTPAATTTGL